MLFIIAGNAREADNYARDNKLSKQDYRYVISYEYLLGIEGKYIKVGSWYLHSDIDNIIRIISTSHDKLKEVYKW